MSNVTSADPLHMMTSADPLYDSYDYYNLSSGEVLGVPAAERAPLVVAAGITALYAAILVLGVLGNAATCLAIVRQRYMHTATNYYLLSLAVSDLLLLVTGLPFELHAIWRPDAQHTFGEAFCVLRGLCAETSANASVLTIVSFTVERYLAICHPLLQHTLSGLTRALRCIALVWAAALLCALFPALQFGLLLARDAHGRPRGRCTVVRRVLPHVFEASSVLFFLVPMLVLTLLYARIALRLRRHLRRSVARASLRARADRSGVLAARSAVVRMLGEYLPYRDACPIYEYRTLSNL